MKLRGMIRQYILAAACAAGALVAPAAQAGPLRVCADPDNLPFSKADGAEHGLYLELAELVGRKLGQPIEYVWWLTYNQRRALRNSMDGCDAYFGLPADADYKLRGLQRTQPFLDVSYALVAPAGVAVSGLDDLKGKRIAVLHGTPPHVLLASRQGFTTSSYRVDEDALGALAKGEVDVALLWGPSAGYLNQRRFDNRWKLTPVSGEGLGGQMAVAVHRGHEALLAGIDKALAELRPQIDALAAKYGFPSGKAVALAGPARMAARPDAVARAEALARSLTVSSGLVRTNGPGAAAGTVSTAATGTTTVAAATPQVAGRTRFNDTCSHCHGSDGFSPVSERDLRKLRSRYKDGWQTTALTTIREGRPDLGMPTWKAVFNDKEVEELLAFLATIQK